MTEADRPRPLKEAARITQMLDIVLGADRFDRGPVDVAQLALEYSAKIAPDSPIHESSSARYLAVSARLSTETPGRDSGRSCIM